MRKLAYLTAVAAIAVLIPLLMFIQKQQMNDIRTYQLQDAAFADAGGAPPGLAVSTAFLGGFRNFIANMLWLRMIRLQDEGQYFEMVQLAEWILQMQPRNSTAAAHLAWNMAFNISVIHHEPADRWRWIHKGIDTLHRALALNPNESTLYHELAWIYQFKMGDQMDDANLYYKYRLADEMYKAFGGKHSPDWKKLSEAAATFRHLFARYPQLKKKLDDLGYSDPDRLKKEFAETGMLSERVSRNLEKAEAGALENYLRRDLIYQLVRIDPGNAQKLEEKYGVFDWLVPETYTVYWATEGIKHSRRDESNSCERLRSQGLKALFTSGRIVFPAGKPSEIYIILPNVTLADAAAAEYRKEAELYYEDKNSPAYVTFLFYAIDTFYLLGMKSKAAEYFDVLQNECRNPETYSRGKRMSLEEFVQKRLNDMIQTGTHKQIMRVVTSLIERSAFALANGEHEAAEKYLQMSEQIYKLYGMKNSSEEQKKRLALPPFEELKKNTTRTLIHAIPELEASLKAELQLQGQTL